MEAFLETGTYIDYYSERIQRKISELLSKGMSDMERAETAYEFVRDEIPHSFDCDAQTITAKASDVLKYGTGICHAKANLLAALLRSQGIPAGFCFQHITLLAYSNRKNYDEYFLKGIYASPHLATMRMLESARCLRDILDNIPDKIESAPDIKE